MKSEQFNFNSKSSAIRGTREKQEKPATRKRDWDRYIYLAILALIVLGISYFVLKSYFIISGEGRVVARQLTVRAPEDIRVLSFNSKTGNNLQQGDSLFTYEYIVSERARVENLEDARGNRIERRNDLENIRSEIILKRQERQNLQDRLDLFQRRKEQIQKEVRLNVETVGELNNVEEEIADIRADLKLVNQELQLLLGRQQRYSSGSERENVQQSSNAISDRSFTYNAPAEGRITNIFKEPLELALKSEKIMAIQRDSAQVQAKALFEREAADDLFPGEEISIEFANGVESRGIIKDIYSAEVDANTTFDLRGIDASERVMVVMTPPTDEVGKQWRSLNGMSLEAWKTLTLF